MRLLQTEMDVCNEQAQMCPHKSLLFQWGQQAPEGGAAVHTFWPSFPEITFGVCSTFFQILSIVKMFTLLILRKVTD